MRKCIAILTLLLLTHRVYGREERLGSGTISAFRAAASTSTNAGDTEGNEADDQKMESDTETDGTDSDQEMKTGGHSDGDSEADDMNGETNSVKNAIRASLKATAMKQPQSSVGQMTGALDAGPDPLQTIKELLEPAAPRASALSAVGSQTGLFDSSSAFTGGSVMPASGALLVTDSSLVSGRLTATTAPEPSAWILAATGLLAPLWKRRRKVRY
jgi:hypothetical protein